MDELPPVDGGGLGGGLGGGVVVPPSVLLGALGEAADVLKPVPGVAANCISVFLCSEEVEEGMKELRSTLLVACSVAFSTLLLLLLPNILLTAGTSLTFPAPVSIVL